MAAALSSIHVRATHHGGHLLTTLCEDTEEAWKKTLRMVSGCAHKYLATVELHCDSEIPLRSTVATHLDSDHHLIITFFDSKRVILAPKPCSTTGRDILEHTFRNGATERHLARSFGRYSEKECTFPDGRRAIGVFDGITNELASGILIDPDGAVTFAGDPRMAPRFILPNTDGSRTILCTYPKIDTIVPVFCPLLCGDVDGILHEAPIHELLLQAFSNTDHSFPFVPFDIFKGPSTHLTEFLNYLTTKESDGVIPLTKLCMEIQKQLLSYPFLAALPALPLTGQKELLMHVFSQEEFEEMPTPLYAQLVQWCQEGFETHVNDILDHLFRRKSIPFDFGPLFEHCLTIPASLSPLNALRCTAIVGHPFSPAAQEVFEALSRDEQEEVEAIAHVVGNPHIFLPPSCPVTPSEYSLNFMWFNEECLPPDAPFLFMEGETEEAQEAAFMKRFVEPLVGWARLHPGTPLSVWYDGVAVEETTVAAVHTLLHESLGVPVEASPFQLRDLRLIDTVLEHQGVFSQESPLYFQVDLLKQIILDNATKRTGDPQYAVFSDFSIKPVPRGHLFDLRTREKLDETGIIAARGGSLGYENNFLILNGQHPSMPASHRKVLIDLPIELAEVGQESLEEEEIFGSFGALLLHWMMRTKQYTGYEMDDKGFRSDVFSTYHNPFDVSVDVSFSIRVADTLPTKPLLFRPSHFMDLEADVEEIETFGHPWAYCVKYFPEQMGELQKMWSFLPRLAEAETPSTAAA